MKRSLAALLALATLTLPGCIYAHVKTYLDTDLNQTKLGAKVGTSEMQEVLALVAWGDASTATAAKNGGITTINHADVEYLAILWFVYSKQTTIVYGD
jgi:hypothetical protein